MNRAVRAHFRAGAALFAFRFIDVRHVIRVERDRTETAGVFATVRKATAAGVRHFVAAHRTFVAGNIDHLYHVGLIVIQPHGDTHTLGKNSAFFVYAATHCGNLPGNDGLGNIDRRLCEPSRPRFTRHFT